MNRETGIARLKTEHFDVLVIGGGATGLGCAVDAASRGHRTALIEAFDFASETSSRSTKLIHGGVRYLQQGNVALVREALAERGNLLRNAPGLVRPLRFVVPAYSWWQLGYLAAGLRAYDVLAGSRDVPRSRLLSRSVTHRELPFLKTDVLAGAVTYWDAQFDDARLAVALAQTAVDHGAAIANYIRAEQLVHEASRVRGARVVDAEAGRSFVISARCVINAAGPFVDEVRTMDVPGERPLLRRSRGSHIVVAQPSVPIGDSALLVPRTTDGRVIFALPWHGSVLIGTTDVPAEAAVHDPLPDSGEVTYLISSMNRCLAAPIAAGASTALFAGLRPLVNRGTVSTARLSREHVLLTAASGLVTIAGGKWTTYRKMAEDTIDAAERSGGLTSQPCRTRTLPLRDVPLVPAMEHAARHEMARTVEDVLSRRRRTLYVDLRQARAEAPLAAGVLAGVLGKDERWKSREIDRFDTVAGRYTQALGIKEPSGDRTRID